MFFIDRWQDRNGVSLRSQMAIVVTIFLGIAIFLTAYTSRRTIRASSDIKPTVSPTSLLGIALDPLVGSSVAAGLGMSTLLKNYVFLVNTAKENAELKAQLSGIVQIRAALDEARLENERLRSILNVNKHYLNKGTSARVIGFLPSGWVEGCIINRGTNNGIKNGLAVVNAQGLVGQTFAVSLNSSKVLFITDRTGGAGVRLQNLRAQGVLRGRGQRSIKLEYVGKDVPVEPGERVVTSGLDGIFPTGILVGVVSKVASESLGGLFQDISMQPVVDFNRLEEVLVLPSVVHSPQVPIKQEKEITNGAEIEQKKL